MSVASLLVKVIERFDQDLVLLIDDKYDGDSEAAGGEDLRPRLEAEAKPAGIRAVHGRRDRGRLGLTSRAVADEAK